MKLSLRNTLNYAILLLLSSPAFATIKLPSIFGDNMVLQRNMKIPVYGWADAGEEVQVDFMGKTFKTTTGADGKWLVKLNSYKAGGPYKMHIAGKSNSLDYSNILIGEVWVASGQSNMEFGIQTEKHAKETMAAATDNQIHFFYVPMMITFQPRTDIPVSNDSPNGKWIVCSPEAIADPKLAWHGPSAVGYYFAQQVRKATGVAVGIINAYKGGTPAQSWMTVEGLQESPAFTKYVDTRQKLVDNLEAATASYPTRMNLYRDSLKTWNDEVGNAFNATIKQWDADVAAAKAAGQTPPPRPKPSRPAPNYPADPMGGWGPPTACYYGIISPIQGYGIKGAIWYQGESNGDYFNDALEYKTLFPRMIKNWRDNWNQGEFPFLFVQLPNFRQPAATPSEGNWPWVREAQQYTLATVKQTGMAVITDVGDDMDIHPTNKMVPGNRLGLVAVRDVYGKKVVASGPVYKSMKVDGNKIIISFDQLNKGLTAGKVSDDGTLSTDAADLKGFGIAGADHKFIWAKAVIDGNNVIVTADGITNPEAVRYNWADNPAGNLYNKDGFPAAPFRTDGWEPVK